MGPSALWLTEFLCEELQLLPGMRVLDLGCGEALSPVFLAREYGVQMWATDIWISATDNAARIDAEGLQDVVFPLRADTRSLPFADSFFDAVVSIDAFEYFGTDATFLPGLAGLVKPKGAVGVVNAGVLREIEQMPDDWPSDFSGFHTAAWWHRHWALSRALDVVVADDLPRAREHWLAWNRILGDNYDACLRAPISASTGSSARYVRLAPSAAYRLQSSTGACGGARRDSR